MSQQRINQVTAQKEISGGATQISYDFEYNGETRTKNISVVKERLYIPGYFENEEGKFQHVNQEMWAAFASNAKNEPDTAQYAADNPNRKFDQDLANSFMGALSKDSVEFDKYAQRFYAKPEANLDKLTESKIGLSYGKKIIERERSEIEKQVTNGKASNLKVEDVKLKDYSTELAEGATKVTYTSGPENKEWTKTFVNNRNYLGYNGEGNKKDVFEKLEKEFRAVKRDVFAMNHYIAYDATFAEVKEIKEVDPGIMTSRGNRTAEYTVALTERFDDNKLVSVEEMSTAAYTVMREEFIKKAEDRKASAEKAEKEKAEEKSEQLDASLGRGGRG